MVWGRGFLGGTFDYPLLVVHFNSVVLLFLYCPCLLTLYFSTVVVVSPSLCIFCIVPIHLHTPSVLLSLYCSYLLTLSFCTTEFVLFLSTYTLLLYY